MYNKFSKQWILGKKKLLISEKFIIQNGRSDRIRTYDPLVPSQVLYQTELRPDFNLFHAAPRHQQYINTVLAGIKLYMKLSLSKNGATGGIRTPDPRLRRPLLYPTELQTQKWSERQDSNLRPPGPKPGALPNWATPRQRKKYYATSFQSCQAFFCFFQNHL